MMEMSRNPFVDYFDRVESVGSISDGDVRELRRLLNEEVAIDRDIAERILKADRNLRIDGEGWTDFVVDSLADLVLWGGPRLGRVERETVAWLSRALRRGGRLAPCASRLLIAIVQQAEAVDESFTVFALSLPRTAPRTLH